MADVSDDAKLSNLRNRYPQFTDAELEAALKDSNGHAGKAAQKLRSRIPRLGEGLAALDREAFSGGHNYVTEMIKQRRQNEERPLVDEVAEDWKDEPECSFCAGSGWYGFGVCSFCDGPKPVKRTCLHNGLVLKRQTSTQFVECNVSSNVSENHTFSEPVCKLCAAQCANVVLRPCGHGGFCEDCTRRIVGEKSTAFCPYCRTPVQAFLKINPYSEISVIHEEFQVKVSTWRR